MSETVSMSAKLSPCGRYRYRLCRSWGEGPFVVFLMFNPSTADASVDDPTIRKCMGFARAWGYHGITVVNLFALRSTDPKELNRHSFDESVGPDNDTEILTALASAGELVCAWGCGSHMRGRTDRPRKVLRAIRQAYPHLQVNCLGTNGDGHPKHPLMLSYNTARSSYGPQMDPTKS